MTKTQLETRVIRLETTLSVVLKYLNTIHAKESGLIDELCNLIENQGIEPAE